MPMDDQDKRLVNGLIIFAVLVLVAYFFPTYGYSAQSAREAEERAKLEESAPKYQRYYPEMLPVHFGRPAAELPEPPVGTYMNELIRMSEQTEKSVRAELDSVEGMSRFSFPDWTMVPEGDNREPGVYFQQLWQRKRNQVALRLSEAKVDSRDPDVGFAKYSGRVDLTRMEAEEYLRQLAIAEKVIDLCIEAKQRQEKFERENNIVPEAFMRIIACDPKTSVPTGPTQLLPNPVYNPDEKNPTSPRFRKYNVKSLRRFMQEYPVEIKLQCDVNTFMRFLHSVRRKGQFLIIRNLNIVAPSQRSSKADSSQIQSFIGDASSDLMKVLEPRDEHVFVTLSAAGMDFFDPVQHPGGLFDPKGRGAKPPPKRGLRTLPGGVTGNK